MLSTPRYIFRSTSCLLLRSCHTSSVLISACETAKQIREQKTSSRKVVASHYAAIRRWNPFVNAICTLVPENEALQQADAIDERIRRGEKVGVLAGLPVAIKDLSQTKGIRTTYGSAIYSKYLPLKNDLPIERIVKADGIVIGKTNTSEFGAGSHTFNSVFGVTLNPYALQLSAGGSSGGSAAALACGMASLAIGSDLGGSVRNPASWCGVVGLRPSLGRVPDLAHKLPWSGLGVTGPMARTVEDVALLMSVISGPTSEVPNCLQEAGNCFLPPLQVWSKPCKIAFSGNLGGHAPVDSDIQQSTKAMCGVLKMLGHTVLDQDPDFCSEAAEVFSVSRSLQYVHAHTNHVKVHGKLIKKTIKEDVEKGRQLTVEKIAKTEERRMTMHRKMARFFGQFEFLVLPVCAVDPFPSHEEWPFFIDGQKTPDHLTWMRICSVISATGCPAISVPAGLSKGGFPMGLQIVGKPGSDLSVLELAKAFSASIKPTSPPIFKYNESDIPSKMNSLCRESYTTDSQDKQNGVSQKETV